MNENKEGDFEILNESVKIQYLSSQSFDSEQPTTFVGEDRAEAETKTKTLPTIENQIEILTWNVLFNVSEHIQGGNLRYRHQMDLLQKFFLDSSSSSSSSSAEAQQKQEEKENSNSKSKFVCVGLQEVTQAWIDIAESCLRNCFLLTLPETLANSSGHGFGKKGRHTVAMIVSHMPNNVKVVRLAGFPRPAIVVDFSFNVVGEKSKSEERRTLRIAVVHTKPWVGEEYEEIRCKQLQALYRNGFKQQQEGENRKDDKGKGEKKKTFDWGCVVGDFNLYSEDEATKCIQSPWIDVWKHLKGENEGFTFDCQRNLLIQQLMPRKTDRLRLDRITLLHDKSHPRSSELSPTFASLFADKPIDAEAVEAAAIARTEKRGGVVSRFASWAKQFASPLSYLFPSDHFGIHCKFEIRLEEF